MHTDVRRSSSLSGILDSPLNSTGSAGVARTLVFHPSDQNAKVKNEQRKKNKKKESLRRCKSSPEKKLSKQSREKNSDAWNCALDKVYVTDLIAEQQPITNQPQLSYFSYLGNNYPEKGPYQAMSSNAEAIINLGNGIFAQNRSPSITNSEERIIHGNNVHINSLMKPDRARLLDCCSCMYCVKAVFYHCTKDRDFERNWADKPCSCETGTDCGARWGILGMFSVFLPCLVCYPIIKVCCKFPFNLTKKS